VNATIDPHQPSTEFRARLEEDVVRAFQRESRFAGGSRMPGGGRFGGLLILLAGILLGFGAEFAAGQAQKARDRDTLIEAAMADRMAAELRLTMASLLLKRAQEGVAIGTVSRESMQSAEADVSRVRHEIERLDLNIAEMRTSAVPARDELWAPLVAGRDFVSERLELEAADRQQALSGAELRVREAERLLRVGLAGPGVATSAEVVAIEARLEVTLVARKLDLRRRFLDRGLSSDAIARELKRFEMEREIEGTTARLKLAQDRATRAQAGAAQGTVSDLDAARAQLEVLELSARLKLLRASMQEAEKAR
jgi:hypothetical protein